MDEFEKWLTISGLVRRKYTGSPNKKKTPVVDGSVYNIFMSRIE